MHLPQATLLTLTLLVFYCCCTVHATEEHHKRAPSGFLGMRGKKSISDAEYGTNEENTITKEFQSHEQASPLPPSDYLLMDKRAPYTSGFVGMRGKKPWDYTDGWDKRSPQGFFGMRGKKSSDLDQDYYDGYPKRAPMGFFGMRGKKYIMQPYFQDEKRAPNGFFGMRGKKDYDDLFYDEEKRAPQSAFFGVRGKRMGFFGVRGKKIPYQFRGKFVGVRGKKSSQPNLIAAENNQIAQDFLSESNLTSKNPNDLEWNQLMLLLTEQDNGENELSRNLRNL